MQEVFDRLRDLQGVLAKKFAILEEIKEIPRTLETKEELLNRGKKAFLEKHEKFERTTAELKTLRISLDEAERSRENSEKQMERISTQREFEALEKEIKDGTAREQSLRKSLLAKEKFCSELAEQLEEHEQLMVIQEEEVKTETEKKDSLLSSKNDEILTLQRQEQLLTPGIDESILFKFERIIKNKFGLGIVAIHGLVCQGCHMTLPVQFVNDVRKGQDFKFCPYCSRILFYEQVEIGEEQYHLQATKDTDSSDGSMSDFVDTEEFDDLM